MSAKATAGSVAVLSLFVVAASAEAQLPKRGTYSAHFGYHTVVKGSEIDKDHYFATGETIGTIFNDTGRGFLHAAAVVCPLANDRAKGVSNVHGYCIVTDSDGDKAFMAWKCRSPQLGARCEGEFQWIGGTGKFMGLTGNNTFNGGGVPKTVSGYALWKGEWQLPD